MILRVSSRLIPIIISCLLLITNDIITIQQYTEKKIVVVIPSYDNVEWYRKNLDSIFNQKYSNWRAIYIDDCSSDETGKLVENYVIEKGFQDKIVIICNEVRCLALANLYYAIHSCEDDEIIVMLDGDDWFAHDDVLWIVNKVYQDPNVWLTYGQYSHPWGGLGCNRTIDKEVIEKNAYRDGPLIASHLRTCYAWLFKCIKKEDLLHNGSFFPMTWDWALMFPMLEMSGGRFKFIREILYIYNTENQINDNKVNPKLQQELEKIIQEKERYNPLSGKESKRDGL